MELDQLLFSKISSFYRRLRAPKVEAKLEAQTVRLEELRAPLCLLSKVLTGRPIEITAAEEEGGWRDDVFFLPCSFSLGSSREENESYYLFRVAYLAMQKQLAYNFPDHQSFSLEEARRQAQATSGFVLQQLFKEYPSLKNIYQALQTALQDNLHYLWGHWMSSKAVSSAVEKKEPPAEKISFPTEILTELKSKPREEVEVLELNQKAMEDYSLGHSFEKVETLEEFKGNWRDCDGSDDLQAHAEALNELDLRQLLRVDQTTHSMLQADFLSLGALSESKEISREAYFETYDEWNYQKREYRKNFCKVFPQKFTKTNPPLREKVLQDYGITLKQLKKKFSSLWTERELHKRQSEGVEIDLDALVENYADRAAGKTPSEKVYLNSRKTQRDIALILLIDRSLSTDSFTQNQRILEVEKNSVFLFSELLYEAGDPFQIDAFSSQTRNHCDYLTLKSFQDSWNQAQGRLAALDTLGYTRIGPALRHASKILQGLKAKRKWILLLSDAKPNDYDRYEGEYGIQDVRQAIREMNQKSIQLYALAVESQARHYLPRMLGQNNFKILPRPELLPRALGEFYCRLKVC
ncbi:MAG: VWA domain-containing protein [Deltaproteobacteria bacterium]|nr:VWA domain-containing protein [Deltaproteobacteria bacterium]